MGRHLIAVILLGTLCLFSNEGWAKNIQLQQKHSSADIKAHCSAAGGDFYVTESTYGCATSKGEVNCEKATKTCQGSCDRCGRMGKRPTVKGFLEKVTVTGPTNR